MPVDPAQLSVLTFRQVQQSLSDLLTGTERPYYPVATFAKQHTEPGHPDSRQAKVCAKVLPSNPFFKEYARQARGVLGLPPEGVDQCDNTDFAGSLGIPIAIDLRITSYLWGAWWLAIHFVKSSLTEPGPVQGLPSSLPQWLQEYALQDQVTAVPEQVWPQWTERRPRFPGSDPTATAGAPLDLISGLFLSAFDLPSRCFEYIRWYILTDDGAFLDLGANPLEVQFDAPISAADGRVHLRISVNGLDSATTKGDWEEVWDQKIAPFLDHLYVNEIQQDRWDEDRLMKGKELEDFIRRGRRGHKPGMKIPEYARFFEHLHDRPTDDLEDALTGYMEKYPEDPSVNENTDLRTLKSNVNRLESIMRPRTKIT